MNRSFSPARLALERPGWLVPSPIRLRVWTNPSPMPACRVHVSGGVDAEHLRPWGWGAVNHDRSSHHHRDPAGQWPKSRRTLGQGTAMNTPLYQIDDPAFLRFIVGLRRWMCCIRGAVGSRVRSGLMICNACCGAIFPTNASCAGRRILRGAAARTHFGSPPIS